MKAATLHQIKKELETYAPKKIMELTLRLIKYKTENKELISYLLFDEDDLAGYIADLRDDVSVMFDDIHSFPPYQTKRGVRKALKFISRYSKYTNAKETESELLLHLCGLMKEKGMIRNSNKVISGIYYKQLEKVEKMLPVLHEELQYDYKQKIEYLRK
jgi:hypothetical protein